MSNPSIEPLQIKKGPQHTLKNLKYSYQIGLDYKDQNLKMQSKRGCPFGQPLLQKNNYYEKFYLLITRSVFT